MTASVPKTRPYRVFGTSPVKYQKLPLNMNHVHRGKKLCIQVQYPVCLCGGWRN